MQAHSVDCQPFDKRKFNAALVEIRKLTCESPTVFVPEIKRFCAESGVAVAFVKEMKKVPWSGVTRWLGKNNAMILLSLRRRGEDKFRFSFFHEAGHVLHDGKKELLINDDSRDDPREVKADHCAAEILVPENTTRKLPGKNEHGGRIMRLIVSFSAG